MSAIEYSLTWYVICDGKARMGDAEELRSQVTGPVTLIGPDSHDWLGVPMLRDGQPCGALVVQSYRPDIGFTDEDLALLEFVGSHILTALERKQGKEELEQRVQLRTLQLAEANRGLQQEIVERQRAEHLQAALFQLAELATADIGQGAFYRRVHAVVGELLNAENFFIALLSDDRQRLTFPYAVDAVRLPPAERPLGRGLSEYVLRRGTALRADNADIEQLERRGEIAPGRMGSPAVCWLGVPLTVGDEVIGLVAVQSYRPDVMYGPADQELLSFVASQIANSLTRRRSAESLKHAYEQLEHRVEERTLALRKEITERERMQDQLRHQVMHDSLTGLPNRSYLRDRIDRVLATMRREPLQRCALLYLDVDRFKIINDSLGHLAGDEVLKEVATRLAGCVRHPDLVARLSGDEFAILLEQEDLPRGGHRRGAARAGCAGHADAGRRQGAAGDRQRRHRDRRRSLRGGRRSAARRRHRAVPRQGAGTQALRVVRRDRWRRTWSTCWRWKASCARPCCTTSSSRISSRSAHWTVPARWSATRR